MDPIDLEIQKRLENLRQPVQQVPTDDELRERLRLLKNFPSETKSSAVANKYVLFPKPRSSADQVDDLMKQFTDEVNIRSHHVDSTSTDIEKRLQKLKSDGQPKTQSMSLPKQSPESDTKVLLRKILAEAALEKKTEHSFPNSVSQSGKSAAEESMDCSQYEEDFCTICDRYPKWMCVDCDKEFCMRCFNEYHEDIGEYHRKKPFIGRRRRSIDSDEYSD